MMAPPWMRRVGLLAAGALASTTPVLLADLTSDDLSTSPVRALAAAAAWRDVLEAHGAPQLPPPSDTESAIVVLDGPAVAEHAPADRATAVDGPRWRSSCQTQSAAIAGPLPALL